MFNRILGITLCLTLLSGCVMIPDMTMSETLQFDAVPPSQQPVGFADLLCCFDCTV